MTSLYQSLPGFSASWNCCSVSQLSSPSPSLLVPITPSPEQFGGLCGVGASMNFQTVPQQAEKTFVAVRRERWRVRCPASCKLSNS